MAVEIPNGAVAVTTVQWTGISGFPTADSVIAAVNQELLIDGLTTSQSSVGFSGLSYPLTGGFSATLNILNQSGQELDDLDLISQLSDAIQTIGGTQVSGAVTQVVSAGTGINAGKGTVTVTPAGTAQNVTNQTGTQGRVCGDPSWGFFDDPAAWLKCLTTGGLTTVGLLAIGLLLGIVLFVYAKAPKIGAVPVGV